MRGDPKMFSVCGYLLPFVEMAGASGPDLGLAPCGPASESELSPSFARAGYVAGSLGTDHFGRLRSFLREVGYERGVGADECFSSGTSPSRLNSATLACVHETRSAPRVREMTAGAPQLHGTR